MSWFATALRALSPWLLATVAFALAYFSPVEEVQSDPAIALLATQSLLDHQTIHLDAYLGDPDCSYDLERDYRIRRHGASVSYYSHGVSLLSLPAVWLANRMGYHMLDQSDEFALQNLLSALCCALLGILLYRICLIYLGPAASLVVASVSLLGSSLLSTLATGLWNVGYEALLLALGLHHILIACHQRDGSDAIRLKLGYLAVLAGLAFLCRPTAAFAILAAILALAPTEWFKQRSIWRPAVLGFALVTIVLITFDLAEWIPRYYSPLKLTPQSPLSTGLYGTLLSPSRGLLVFSPFLVPVVAACLWYLPTLLSDRLFRLAGIWTGLHVLAIATKGVWWGGHSYGPRLLAEVMLPAVLVSCLTWQQIRRRARPPVRILLASVYLACGLGALYIHSYQGLFNHHVRRWNWTPNIDQNTQLVFNWRYPQFLASEESIEQRAFEVERLKLGTYSLGQDITDSSDAALGALWHDWYPPEPGWRWSRGGSPEILLNLGQLPVASRDPEGGSALFLFQFRANSLGRQEVALAVNGTEVGRIELDGAIRERAFAFEHDLLLPGQENSFRFDLPGATSTATDSRVLALALHSFKLQTMPDPGGVAFDDATFFVRGFSTAEVQWRWTDRRRAVIDYPVGDTTDLDTLELTGSVLDHQPVGIRLNGVNIGKLHFEGGFDTVATQRLTFDQNLLRPRRMNQIELLLPRARNTAEDARLLGLAFVRLRICCA